MKSTWRRCVPRFPLRVRASAREELPLLPSRKLRILNHLIQDGIDMSLGSSFNFSSEISNEQNRNAPLVCQILQKNRSRRTAE